MSDAIIEKELPRHPNHIGRYPTQYRQIVVPFRLIAASHPAQLSRQPQRRHRHD